MYVVKAYIFKYIRKKLNSYTEDINHNPPKKITQKRFGYLTIHFSNGKYFSLLCKVIRKVITSKAGKCNQRAVQFNNTWMLHRKNIIKISKKVSLYRVVLVERSFKYTLCYKFVLHIRIFNFNNITYNRSTKRLQKVFKRTKKIKTNNLFTIKYST